MANGLDADEIFQEAMQTDQVRAGVMDAAQKVASRARRYTTQAGGSARITIQENPLPSGRFSVDVVSDSPGEEYGGATGKRIRALRRAAREVRK